MKKNLFVSLIALLTCIFIQNSVFANVIRFVQVTDVHYNNKIPYRKEVLKQTIEDINKQKDISFVIFTGDNIDSPKPEYLEDFVSIITKLNVPYYIVIGNHDVFKNGGLSKQQYIETIKEHNIFYKPKKPNYVFKKNGFVFIVVDGAKEVIPGTIGYYRKDTLDWLDKQLKKYNKYPVIIAQHYPLVEPKIQKSHETYKKEEYLERLDKHKNIIAVISGHYHVNGENTRNGVYHISTPTLMTPPNCYKIIEISTTKGFSPLIYTQLREVNPEEN